MKIKRKNLIWVLLALIVAMYYCASKIYYSIDVLMSAV